MGLTTNTRRDNQRCRKVSWQFARVKHLPTERKFLSHIPKNDNITVLHKPPKVPICHWDRKCVCCSIAVLCFATQLFVKHPCVRDLSPWLYEYSPCGRPIPLAVWVQPMWETYPPGCTSTARVGDLPPWLYEYNPCGRPIPQLAVVIYTYE